MFCIRNVLILLETGTRLSCAIGSAGVPLDDRASISVHPWIVSR